MKQVKGYYCIVQYCPDLSKLEAANVGVILFCPEPHFIRATVGRSNDRIRRFFGSEDRNWEQINAVKAAIEERLEVEGERFRTLDDLNRFISTRANEIQITPPRPVKVGSPEQELELLYRQLVGSRRRRTAAPREDPVAHMKNVLEETFRRERVERFVKRDVTVTLPTFHTSLTVPYAYQNGRFNLVQPASFDDTSLEKGITRACRYAVEGHSLFQRPDPNLGELQLVLIGEFDALELELKAVVHDILKENKVRLFSLENLSDLIEDIRPTGEPSNPPRD